jgi:hypothetical protein
MGRGCRHRQRGAGVVSAPVCPIAAAVVADIASRADVGLRKYGTTLARTDLSRRQWLEHAYQEALDLALYLRRLMAMEPDPKSAAAVAGALTQSTPAPDIGQIGHQTRLEAGLGAGRVATTSASQKPPTGRVGADGGWTREWLDDDVQWPTRPEGTD